MTTSVRRIVIAVGVVGLLLVALIGWRLIAPRRAVERYRAELQSQGVRLTTAEFRRPVTPEQIAISRRFDTTSSALSRAGKVLPQANPLPMQMVGPGRARVSWRQAAAVDPFRKATNDWATLAAELESVQPHLQVFREVARGERARWPLDYSLGFMLPLPHLLNFRNSSRWLGAATMLALRDGQLKTALDLLETQLGLLRIEEGQGLRVGEVVRAVDAAAVWASSWEALQAEGWSDQQLARLQAAWASLEFVRPLIEALELERAIGVEEYARCRQDPSRVRQFLKLMGQSTSAGAAPNTPSGAFQRSFDLLNEVIVSNSGLGVTAWAKLHSWADEQCFLELLTESINAAKLRVQVLEQPYHDTAAALRGKNFLPRVDAARQERQSRYLMASRMGMGLDFLETERAFRAEMQRQMMLTAIALRRYQLRHGELPETLAELVPDLLPALPVDWMDGHPLRYRPTGPAGFLLYSVSLNGVDDGGDTGPSDLDARDHSLERARDFVWPQPEELLPTP